MKRKFSSLVALALVFLIAALPAFAEVYDQAEVESQVMEAWQDAIDEAAEDPVRLDEVTSQTQTVETDSETHQLDVFSITDGTNTMRYLMKIGGDPDENGLYPLYICLHGGGSDEEDGHVNNGQWVEMFEYYADSVTNGIYVAVRGINNEWNLHFDDASYPLYDRLIEDMILFFNADPNRVYLLGYSAGGDGVYAIAPRMADRFAAVNESSGHPNGVSLKNVANLPFCLQSGIYDTMFDPMRSVAAASFDKTLADYHDTYGFGYEHKVYIHVPDCHFITDCDPAEGSTQTVLADPQAFVEAVEDPQVAEEFDADDSYNDSDEAKEKYTVLTKELGLETTQTDTNAVRFVNQYIRSANPDALVWDLSVRAAKRETTSFYWLQADMDVNTGLVVASFDKDSNTFTVDIKEAPNGDFSILLRPSMVDFSRPVYVVCNGKQAEVDVQVDEDLMAQTAADTLDPEMVSAAKVSFSSLGLTD